MFQEKVPGSFARPLVTCIIATRDRPEELRRSLNILRHLRYGALEMLVIDDGSAEIQEKLVHEAWPGAVYRRESTSAGQSQRRSEGFELAKGEYILQLDDDSYPVNADALEGAVAFMQSQPEVGILSFQIFNGQNLPDHLHSLPSKYHASFVGCGALIRTAAVRQVGGYREFFENEWEEEELSLRIMKAGWAIYFLSDILIHHHVSLRNRHTSRTWMRGFRNKLWSIVMHFPARRIPLEVTWVMTIAGLDALRLLRFRALVQGIAEFCAGLPRALRLRDPMSSLALRRYDAMRFSTLRTREEYESPHPLCIRDVRQWFRETWWNRPRQRSFWDRRPGDIGHGQTVKYAHEYTDDRRGGQRP